MKEKKISICLLLKNQNLFPILLSVSPPHCTAICCAFCLRATRTAVEYRVWYDNEVPHVTQYIRLMTIATSSQFTQCEW